MVLTEKLLRKIPFSAQAAMRTVVEQEVSRFLYKTPRITKKALARLETSIRRHMDALGPVSEAPGRYEAEERKGGHGGDRMHSETINSENSVPPLGMSGLLQSTVSTSALNATKGREWLLLDTHTFMKGSVKDQSEKDSRRRAAMDVNNVLHEQVSVKKKQKERERVAERQYADACIQDVTRYHVDEADARERRTALMIAQRNAQEQQVAEQHMQSQVERQQQEEDDKLQVEWCKTNIEQERQQRMAMLKKRREEAAEVGSDICLCVSGGGVRRSLRFSSPCHRAVLPGIARETGSLFTCGGD